METVLSELYCRLCADLKPVSVLTNMVINTEICREVTNKLTRLDLHVNFNTKLPKTVCSECINSLEHAYDFVKSVELAQEAFEDYDSSVFDDMKDEVSDDDSMDKGINDDLSIKTEESIPNESEVDQELLVEYVPKSKAKEKNSKSIPGKRAVESKTTTLRKPVTSRQRHKPKISADVDLDTWQDYNWLCAVCDKYFPSPSELRVHSMQFHYMCNAYRCFDCRERALHMDNFVTHISRHRPVLTLMCYKCSQKFETLKELRAHKATHFDTEYICRGCNTTYQNEEELDDHMRIFYKNAEANAVVVTENNSLTCVICEKTSKSKLTLSRHLLLHTDRKRTHVCDSCSKSFYNRKELIQHQTVHVEERPYKCQICHYSFKIIHDLKKHAINIHFRPKRFACEICGKRFRLNKEMLVHKAVHTDIRPYECTFCDKTYRFKHLLKQHLSIHTGIKPYACAHCPMTFRNWSNFNKHSKDVHDIDNAKRKRTSEDLYALDPETKEVIYPDEEKINEWKKEILADMKKGRPRKITKGSKNKVKSLTEQDSSQSDS
ncbi:hypothetical protein PYW08_011422 [Mythimna loreyi]|uniref:Uncharacterized protein n=1 Tax=Mythimna loreyi TaxID=667449 RepID=A0ACC2Q378_9NEOP|nr:hypothetical protein PYW08_011422 [Mythimna loreyi]